MKNRIAKQTGLLVITLGVLGFCGFSQAQQQLNQQQDFNQGFGRGNRNNGGGFNVGGGPGGGGRNRRQVGLNSMQVADADYSIIATKSIFLRDRRDALPVARPGFVDPNNLPPEQLFVVTGIVFEQGGFRAYVEHLLQSGLTQLKVGDKIATGEVTEIQMGGMKYRKPGSDEEKWIEVSSTLEGKKVDSIQAERLRLQAMTGGGGGGGVQFTERPQFNDRQFSVGGVGGAITGGRAGGGNNGGGNNGGGGRGRGGFVVPSVPPPPLAPAAGNMTLEERMRLRRMTEGQPGAQPAPVAVEEPADQPAEQPSPPAVAPAPDVDSLTNLTLEERMRLRRLQESGQ